MVRLPWAEWQRAGQSSCLAGWESGDVGCRTRARRRACALPGQECCALCVRLGAQHCARSRCWWWPDLRYRCGVLSTHPPTPSSPTATTAAVATPTIARGVQHDGYVLSKPLKRSPLAGDMVTELMLKSLELRSSPPPLQPLYTLRRTTTHPPLTPPTAYLHAHSHSDNPYCERAWKVILQRAASPWM